MISATHANAAVGRRSIDWKRYARVGAATIIAAVVANVLFYYFGQLLVNYDPDFVILTSPGGAIIFTFFPALAAVLIYGGLLRFAANPDKIFTIISAVVLALSVIPDLTYIPGVEGSSNGQTAILIIMHVIAATVIVGMLTQRAASAVR